MGICESLFNSSSNSENDDSKDNPYKRNTYKHFNNNQIESNNKPKGNYFRSPIGDSKIEDPNKFNNMSLSQSQMTNGNNSYYPPKKTKLFTYVNKYKQNGNLQTSLATGSLQGGNNYSSIISGNKGDSKFSDTNMSTSKSFGEFIVEGKINKNMEGDKDFNNFMKMNNNDNLGDSRESTDDNNKIVNININRFKKDLNYYHKKNSNSKNLINNNSNLKEIKERNKEEEESNRNIFPMPMDTIE
jgi:hypothetical protein